MEQTMINVSPQGKKESPAMPGFPARLFRSRSESREALRTSRARGVSDPTVSDQDTGAMSKENDDGSRKIFADPPGMRRESDGVGDRSREDGHVGAIHRCMDTSNVVPVLVVGDIHNIAIIKRDIRLHTRRVRCDGQGDPQERHRHG
jgi:hypothetical protein